ncbi:MAG: riboflavin biosynthesis protein RibF [Chloroflexota bacterium]|nr:riboflavin biosynthesis protein RibF [Chloroflexota bacterium]
MKGFAWDQVTREFKPAARVVTIGTFDGVHRGHQHLLNSVAERAASVGAISTAVTFEPIPAMVLRPDHFPGRISMPADKRRRLSEQNLDELLTLPFTLELSQVTAEEFMGELRRVLTPIEVWVGEAFALGRRRLGDVDLLRKLGDDLGYRLVAVPRVEVKGAVVSSGMIRDAILEGDVSRAKELLCRPFRVAGVVIHGEHLGRTLGFPTANFKPAKEQVAVADGIYASFATLAGEDLIRPAMTYVGTRPTVNSGERQVETHILDFDGDLYGQDLRVDLIKRLRGDAVFDSLNALVAQLRHDEATTREVLSTKCLAKVD